MAYMMIPLWHMPAGTIKATRKLQLEQPNLLPRPEPDMHPPPPHVTLKIT